MLTYRGRFPSPVMEKLIITVAPTGSVPRKKDTPHVPVTPDEIAETAYRCAQECASIIHVHCRDENERPTSLFEIFRETVDTLRQRTNLVVMTSTMAIVLGGHVRVGLEDNLYLKKGVLARNEELVARARHLADDLQREVATPDEARAIMGLAPRR